MTQLTNADEWWAEYARIKGDIKGYIHPMDVTERADHPLVVARPIMHQVLQEHKTPPEDIHDPTKRKTIYDVYDHLERERDPRLHELLLVILEEAPDHPSIHDWPSWHYFCDLLCEGPHCLDLDHDDDESGNPFGD
jgi:hypothetical protein